MEIPQTLINDGALSLVGYQQVDGIPVEYPLHVAKYVSDFYTSNEHVYLLDIETRICYFKHMYDYITINGAFYQDIILHHVWNAFDELGLLVDCRRLFGEENINYKQRIFDVFRHPGGSNRQGIIDGLSRELNVPTNEIDIQAMSDLAFKGSLVNEDGSPSEKIISYAKKINEVMATTWGSTTWDKGYWASVDQENIGIDYLPHVWDASIFGWLSTDFQSGIGDGNDLLVSAPKREMDDQAFKYYVGLSGVSLQEKDIYPPHAFKYKVVAKGTIMSESVVPEEYYYTVVASPKIPLIFKVKAELDYNEKLISTFNDAPIRIHSTYASLTEEEQLNSYFISDSTKLEVVSGHSIPNPAQRYVEIEVELHSNASGTQTPTIDDITLTWKNSANVDKSIKIDTQAGSSQVGDNYTVGFTENTWSDVGAIIRIQNDNINLEFTPGGDMILAKGAYSKTVDTDGDWNRSTNKTNVVITDSGEIKLSL